MPEAVVFGQLGVLAEAEQVQVVEVPAVVFGQLGVLAEAEQVLEVDNLPKLMERSFI
jgi:hypothetical protein